MVKVKPTFTTYSKRKQKLKKPATVNLYQVQVHVHNHVTNNIICFQSSESSGDEFDKLLRGTSNHQTSYHCSTSTSIEKRQLWSRQDSVSLYNSDATPVASSISSVHLFKDTWSRSKDHFSFSKIPDSPLYSLGNNKCVKIPNRKNNNRIFKKKIRKIIKAPPKALIEASPGTSQRQPTATSSTPTFPFLKANSQLLESHMSPILATGLGNKSKCRVSTDIFGDESDEESEHKVERKQSLGLSALVEGLGNLELVTPRAVTKRKTSFKKSLGIMSKCEDMCDFVSNTKRKTLNCENNELEKTEAIPETNLNCEINNKSVSCQDLPAQSGRKPSSERLFTETCSNIAAQSSKTHTRSKLTNKIPAQQDLSEDSVCIVNEQLETPVSSLKLPSSEQARKSIVHSEDANLKKPNVSPIPPKAWRRSVLNKQNCVDSKRYTVGPAFMAKLVKDVGPLNLSSVKSRLSCNVIKSITKPKEIEDPNKVDKTTFDMTGNLSILNHTDILKRISVRPKRDNRSPDEPDCLYTNREFDIQEMGSEDSHCVESESYTESELSLNNSDMKKLSEEESNLELPTPMEHRLSISKATGALGECDEGEFDTGSCNISQSDLNQTSFNRETSSSESPADKCTDINNSFRTPDKLNQTSFNRETSSSESPADKCTDINNSFRTPDKLEHTTNFETPPILRMDAKTLSCITTRKKTPFSKKPPRNFDIFNDSSTDDEEEEVACRLEDLPALTCFAVVLARCDLEYPLPFTQAFPDRLVASGNKIGEGVFGEVFLIHRSPTEQSVVKIIPVEGTKLVNGQPQKRFEEVLPELIISEQLSSLRSNPACCTSGFCELKNKFCIQGEYPQTFKKMWYEYDRLKRSENDNVDMFEHDQLYVALELEHAGEPLESYRLPSAKQAYSVFLQVIFTLAVAESELEFEHRDLHVGNVLVKKTPDDYIIYVQDSFSFKVPTFGFKATIIDFTLSRIIYKEEVLFLDLANDPEQFEGQGDYQFDIYRFMKEDLGNNWSLHAPITNIRWLDYLADKLLTRVKYYNKKTKQHTQYLKKLDNIKKMLVDFDSASNLAEFLTQTHQETIGFLKTD